LTGPRYFFGVVAKENRRLTTALAYVATARVNHPAATGIDHLKTAGVIRNGAIAVMLLIFFVRFTDVGFFVAHGASSLTCIASPIGRGTWFLGFWVFAGHPVTAGGLNAGIALVK
jgi:hypothetical protein